MRESLREEALPEFHVPVAGGLGCFRVMGASGKRIVDDAGLDPRTLDETELLRGLSHGAPLCLLREAGLI